MTVASIHLLLNIIAFAIVGMDLALAIVYSWFRKFPWTNIFLVFLASLLGCTGMQMLVSWSDISFSGLTSFVLMTIWKSLFIADGAFILTFIAYFTTWIIAHPWRNPYKTIFISSSLIYFVVGIFSIVKPNNMVFDAIEYILGGFVLLFCLVVLIKNLKGIENKVDANVFVRNNEKINNSKLIQKRINRNRIEYDKLLIPVYKSNLLDCFNNNIGALKKKNTKLDKISKNTTKIADNIYVGNMSIFNL